MKFNYLLLSVLSLLLVLTSCQEEEEIPGPDTRRLLVNRNWRLTTFTANAPNGNTVDLFAAFLPCDRDDTWRFADNNYYEKDESLIRCDTLKGPIYETGVWSFTDNTLTLKPNSTATDKIYTVEEVNGTTLRLQSVEAKTESTVIYNLTFINE